MTRHDFYLIIIESFEHITKQTFFEEKRKAFNCIPNEYANGLREIFETLNYKVNRPDYDRAKIITPEGDIQFYNLKSGEDGYAENVKNLKLKGVLSFPFKKNLTINIDGQLRYLLTDSSLAELWPELEIYLKSIETSNTSTVGIQEEAPDNKEQNSLFADLTPRTFKVDCTIDRLISIRGKLIDAKIISTISEDEFVYLFTGKPIIIGMKALTWKETRPLGHEFLKRFVYRSEQFNFRQVNDCIKYPKSKKLDSNCSSTAEYRNDDILNPIDDMLNLKLNPIPGT